MITDGRCAFLDGGAIAVWVTIGNPGERPANLVARIRERVPGYGIEHFLRAFRFDDDTQRLFRSSARQIDFTGS